MCHAVLQDTLFAQQLLTVSVTAFGCGNMHFSKWLPVQAVVNRQFVQGIVVIITAVAEHGVNSRFQNNKNVNEIFFQNALVVQCHHPFQVTVGLPVQTQIPDPTLRTYDLPPAVKKISVASQSVNPTLNALYQLRPKVSNLRLIQCIGWVPKRQPCG